MGVRGSPMITVEAYRDRVVALAAVRALGVDRVPLAEACGRVLAGDLTARFPVPPFDNSAMDGFAVRAADTVTAPVDLAVVGESAAAGGPIGARVRSDWVRAGILCYGSAPDFPEHDLAHWGLRPTMTLRSRLIATQQLQRGDSVGYGSRFTAEAAMRIGIVACGYADGYPRHAGSGTPVLVDGQRTHTVGRVSMDMLAVDLQGLPQADVGSEVTLWGLGPGGSMLAIDEVAQAAATIGYELMCALAPRVPVQVVD